MADSDEQHTPDTSLEWTRIISERRIADAVDAGEFDNLPGRGQPLHFDDDDPLTPAHLRAANRVLKNARVLPTWISLEQEIEAAKADAAEYADEWIALVQARRADAALVGRARAEYERLMRRANDLILKHNLLTTFVHRAPIPFRVKLRLQEWDEAMAALLGERGGDARP